ncbi:hypothetical protein EV363DRAFT_1503351 [Boletus edulis]|nr:hypothetical protein EV363DRAFT_1503351 [Boletus edulis]
MNPGDRSRNTSTSILTKFTRASAPFISTFLLVHLSAPLLANVGGSSLSSNAMLLGREYYQTPFGEKYLLLTPLAIHVASGLAHRLLTPSSKQPRKATSTLSLAAYSALIFVPIHFFTHRLAPTNTSPPIFAVGPAELDYEFWCSWALYAGLVVSVVVHAVEGVNILCTTWFGTTRLSSRIRKLVAGAAAVPVMLGLWTLSREPLMALSSTVERYAACLTTLWVYRV